MANLNSLPPQVQGSILPSSSEAIKRYTQDNASTFKGDANKESSGAALAAIMSLIATGLSIANTNRTNKRNEELYREERDYNTPINQRQRLLDAGINPFGTSYQNTTQPNANSTQSPFDTGAIQSLSSIPNNLVNMRLQEAQAKNLEADTANKEIRNAHEEERQNAEIKKLISERGFTEEQTRNLVRQYELLDANIKNIAKQTDNIEWQQQFNEARLAWEKENGKRITDIQFMEYKLREAVNPETIKEIQSRYKLNDKQIEKLDEEILKVIAECALSKEEVTSKRIENLFAGVDFDLMSFDDEFRDDYYASRKASVKRKFHEDATRMDLEYQEAMVMAEIAQGYSDVVGRAVKGISDAYKAVRGAKGAKPKPSNPLF